MLQNKGAFTCTTKQFPLLGESSSLISICDWPKLPALGPALRIRFLSVASKAVVRRRNHMFAVSTSWLSEQRVLSSPFFITYKRWLLSSSSSPGLMDTVCLVSGCRQAFKILESVKRRALERLVRGLGREQWPRTEKVLGAEIPRSPEETGKTSLGSRSRLSDTSFIGSLSCPSWVTKKLGFPPITAQATPCWASLCHSSTEGETTAFSFLLLRPGMRTLRWVLCGVTIVQVSRRSKKRVAVRSDGWECRDSDSNRGCCGHNAEY